MYKQHCVFYLLFIALIATTSLFSCNDDFEDYSTSPQDILAFSTDTLSFDTVLTTINSPTLTFKVYNENSKSLLISSVRLTGGNESSFKINVDGFAGSSFENIEILAKDSLFILVNVTPAENGEIEPVIFRDYVVFQTNGVEQKVVLEAQGQDVFKWKGITLEKDTIIENSKPFLVYDSLIIDQGVTLELREGTTFYMAANAELIVKGTLKIKGSLEKPVSIRGSRTDYLNTTPPIPYDKVPGQWGGIRFTSESFENEIEYAHIRNAKFGMDFKLSDLSLKKLDIKNSILTNVSGTLIKAVNCSIEASNCEFSNSKGLLLYLIGGKYNFTHCTVANFYPSSVEMGWGNSENQTLYLTDTYYPETEDDEEPADPQYFPVEEANFLNTIIWGLKYINSSGIYIEEEPETPINFFFQNCIIPNQGKNDDDFVNCQFQVDPLFQRANSRTQFYLFDFRLQENSPARDEANQEVSRNYPYDINGIYRFEDGSPDIGVYEYYNDESEE